MSGHSKWNSIKHKKGAADAKRGKIFTKHAKFIFIAARDGGIDPDMNAALRAAIINAKSDNVPNANIDKAIKKASGEGKDAVILEEAMYEGFGPVGTALCVEVITDNKNRSYTNVKNIFSKNGGTLGESGSVGWMFERKGVISAKASGKDTDEAELQAIDAGAEDLSIDGNVFEIITDATQLMIVRDKLEAVGFDVEKAEISYLPKDSIKIDNVDNARKIFKLMDALDDDEDVSNIYSNFDISDEIMESI